MEKLLEPQFSWASFGLLLVLVGLGYVILRAIHRKINSLTLNRNLERILFLGNQRILIIYEPIAIIVLSSVWVLVNPLWHGILALFFIVVAFPHIRNYMTGRLTRISNELAIGKNIIVQKEQGTISQLAPLGIYIMMDNGLRYFTYNQLATEGYTIVSGSDLGEYCTLAIKLHEGEDSQKQCQWLLHMLMAAPYTDSSYQPTFLDRSDIQANIKLLLQKGNYQDHIAALVNDWGYNCQLSY
ncbi:MAG: hypothetical protein GY810_13675 [Aureispira sp.]|nr:hypothetical protein [Aureispira sp.]